jgi:hypothetical protein
MALRRRSHWFGQARSPCLIGSGGARLLVDPDVDF